MSVLRAVCLVHPTASRGHTLVAMIDHPTRGEYDLADSSGDHPGEKPRYLYRGPSSREASARLERWLDWHRARGFHDQLALPVAWQGWIAAMGGMSDPGLPADSLGRWRPLPVQPLPLRELTAYARSGEYSAEVLPAIPARLRRVWIVGHPDGAIEVRDAADLRPLSVAAPLGRHLRESANQLRGAGPYVLDAVIEVREGQLRGPLAVMDLLMSMGTRLTRQPYRERLGHLLEFLSHDHSQGLVALDPLDPRRLRANDSAAWSMVRLIASEAPYEPDNPDANLFVLAPRG
jgi:hypothetical protein